MLNCVIIEDDSVSMTLLENLIQRTAILDLKQTFTDPLQALDILNNSQIDLLFLDVEMPELTGFEVITCLNKKPQIIITSAHNKYATEAFDFDVCDFLLKPITNYSRFLKAVLKAKDFTYKTNDSDSIFIKVNSLLINLNLDDILWCEAYGDYVKIFTIDNHYTVYSKFGTIVNKLPASKFFKVHRSFLVNLSKIENIDNHNIQIKDKIIPISPSNKEQLMQRITTL